MIFPTTWNQKVKSGLLMEIFSMLFHPYRDFCRNGIKIRILQFILILSVVLIQVFCGFEDIACEAKEPVDEIEMVVTASKIPSTFSDTTRNVIIITREEIAAAPVHCVQDILKYALGVDMKPRGVFGAQSDVSIRGGTFEQTLILIDGVKVSDPQTGHHNMDLPVSLDDIERIEILKGQGSRLYGPNAFGGTINIITRQDRNKYANLRGSGGENKFVDGSLSLSYPYGSSGHNFSFSKKKSDGYRPNTEFDISTISYKSFINVGKQEAGYYFGYVDKEFGANSFYSDLYPNEWEHTETFFLNGSADLNLKEVLVSPKIYWRRHKDDFILERDDPDWYRNRHTTDVYGIEFQSTIRSQFGSTAFGSEFGTEEIESSNLGNHDRNKGGFFVEHRFESRKKITLVAGVFAYHYSKWGWTVWPGIDIGIPLSDRVKLFGSLGRSFRVPTYTELYYDTPANKGDPDLKPEEAWSFEAGMRWSGKGISGSTSFFRREGRNLIDWLRESSSDPWQVRNISRLDTTGFEISAGFQPSEFIPDFPFSPRIGLSYAYLDSSRETGDLESKYVLDQLKHQFLADIYHNLFFGLKFNWKLRYKDRLEYDTSFIVDTRISWNHKNVTLFMDVTNLFNTFYTGVGTIPMPDRWILAGLNINLMSANQDKE